MAPVEGDKTLSSPSTIRSAIERARNERWEKMKIIWQSPSDMVELSHPTTQSEMRWSQSFMNLCFILQA